MNASDDELPPDAHLYRQIQIYERQIAELRAENERLQESVRCGRKAGIKDGDTMRAIAEGARTSELARARELLASTEAQVASLIRQRDEARAERTLFECSSMRLMHENKALKAANEAELARAKAEFECGECGEMVANNNEAVMIHMDRHGTPGEATLLRQRFDLLKKDEKELKDAIRTASLAWMVLKRRVVAPDLENCMAVLDALFAAEAKT